MIYFNTEMSIMSITYATVVYILYLFYFIFQSYWSSSNQNASQLYSFLTTSIKDIKNMHSKNISKPTALMAHLSFAEKQVTWDVSNLWFGEYNGIRYMAGKLAEKGLDSW